MTTNETSIAHSLVDYIQSATSQSQFRSALREASLIDMFTFNIQYFWLHVTLVDIKLVLKSLCNSQCTQAMR